MAAATEDGGDGDPGGVGRYTRNHPYSSTVLENYLLSREGSEKETRHIVFSLEEGMTYTPGDSIGVLPENRAQAVAEVLAALRFTGDERVLDHYKVEIGFEEALRTRLSIGALTRGSIGQYAKLPGAENVSGRGLGELKALVGPENKAKAEDYCWGREFIDLITDFPGAVTKPQELFNVLPRLVPRLYSIASSQRRRIRVWRRRRCAWCAMIRAVASGRACAAGNWASVLRWAQCCRCFCIPTRTSDCPRTIRFR